MRWLDDAAHDLFDRVLCALRAQRIPGVDDWNYRMVERSADHSVASFTPSGFSSQHFMLRVSMSVISRAESKMVLRADGTALTDRGVQVVQWAHEVLPAKRPSKARMQRIANGIARGVAKTLRAWPVVRNPGLRRRTKNPTRAERERCREVLGRPGDGGRLPPLRSVLNPAGPMLVAVELDLLDFDEKNELPRGAHWRRDLADLAKKEFGGRSYRRPKNARYAVIEWSGYGTFGRLLDWLEDAPGVVRYAEITEKQGASRNPTTAPLERIGIRRGRERRTVVARQHGREWRYPDGRPVEVGGWYVREVLGPARGNPANGKPPRKNVGDGVFDDGVVEGAARALWADLYSTEVDALPEDGYDDLYDELRPGQGGDLMDVLPDLPDVARDDAKKFLAAVVDASGVRGVDELVERAASADGVDLDDFDEAELLGHYLMMQGLGHGVSWFDDHARFDVEIPPWMADVEVRNAMYDVMEALKSEWE